MSAHMTPVDDELRRPSIAISDVHLLVAQGLARALSRAYEIKAVLRSGRELETLVLTDPPDAIITEFNLLDQSGLETLENTRATQSKVPFVFFTSQSDPAALQRAFYAGARGVVAKLEGVDALQSAIDLALKGKAYLSGAFMPVLMGDKRPEVHLSTRQRVVLQLLDQGMTAQQIADRLCLSRRTVESHKIRLQRATHTHSLIELLSEARRLGLLDPVRRRASSVS